MTRRLLFAAALLLLSLSVAAAAAPPAPAPPAEKWEWRPCDDEEGKTKRHYALEVKELCVDPWPISIGSRWDLWLSIALNKGQRTLRGGVVTLKIYALKHLLVYSATEDLCRASTKKKQQGDGFYNAIARRSEEEQEQDDGGGSGCPLHSGEESLLHLGGTWTSWAPESDKYVLRVMVHSHERPHPTSELMCVDIDVVALKPPSAS